VRHDRGEKREALYVVSPDGSERQLLDSNAWAPGDTRTFGSMGLQAVSVSPDGRSVALIIVNGGI